MSRENKERRYKYFDSHNITKALVDEGAHIIYCREALYPVVEVQVRIREKSREQLGDIEKTILAILQTCPASAESVSRLMGITGGKLCPTMFELEGRGLVQVDANGLLNLSELGSLSVQYGVEVLDVDRSLLLCGMTGRLLPREFYSVQRVTPGELKDRSRFRDLLPEAEKIELSGLDLTQISDRRAVNLPDEAMTILGILDYQPLFLWGILVFYRDRIQQEIGEVIFPGKTIDWLPMGALRDFLSEPLGFSSRQTPEQVKAEIQTILVKTGVELAEPIWLDSYQNPVVSVMSLPSRFLDLDFNGRPFLLFFGSDHHRPVPVGQFPFGGEKGFQQEKKVDLLCGRAISFRAASSELKMKVDSLRVMDQALDDYYRTSRHERTKSPVELIVDNLASHGLDIEGALALGRTHGPKNLRNILMAAGAE